MSPAPAHLILSHFKPDLFREMRRTIYNILIKMPDVGTEIPVKWLKYD